MSRALTRGEAATAGLVAGGLAVGGGLLLAGAMEEPSPIDAVGSVVIDHVPAWLKDLAIRWFGTNDKLALRVGIVVLLAVSAAVVGLAARRRRWVGPAGITAFGALGAWAAASRPGASGAAVWPSLIGTIVGCAALWRLSGPRPAIIPGPSQAPLGWDRRRFIGTTAGLAAGAVTTGAVGIGLERRRVERIRQAIPNTLPAVSGQSVPGTATATGATAAPPAQAVAAPPGAELFTETPFVTPSDRFYRIDTALSFPNIDPQRWAMEIGGMVKRPLRLTYADLLARSQVQRMVTLACVSNEVGGPYIGNAVWQGVLLRDLLDEAGIADGAEQVFSTSLDGWTCGFPVEVATAVDRDCLVAVGMNGQALPLEHGFPARLVVPGLYGYVSATKWLDKIELNRWSDAEGYWVPRGWSRDAPIKTMSRIDVPRGGQSFEPGPIRFAGVAWAQHTGVAKVEVRIDGGEWAEARLGADAGNDAWRQWVFDWDASGRAPARYVAEVRATDKSGYTQTEQRSRPDPDGATGYHSRGVNIR